MFSYGSPKNLRSRFKAEIVKKQHLGLEINYLSYIPYMINRWYAGGKSVIYQ